MPGLPHITGMTDACHYTQPLVEMNLMNFLSRLASNLVLPISASQAVGITGMSHCTKNCSFKSDENIFKLTGLMIVHCKLTKKQ
jgi:hypothetical protein